MTIDELLSGEKLLSIAEKENASNMQNLCALLTGMIDILYLMLIILPLYPKVEEGYISAVNLFHYAETTALNQMVYWGIFLTLSIIGLAEIVFTKLKKAKMQKYMLTVSILFSILTVLVLGLTGETYATVLSFLLFVLKGFSVRYVSFHLKKEM